MPRGPSGCMHDVPEEWIDVTNVRRLNLLSVTQDECCVHMLHTYITAADGRDVVDVGEQPARYIPITFTTIHILHFLLWTLRE